MAFRASMHAGKKPEEGRETLEATAPPCLCGMDPTYWRLLQHTLTALLGCTACMYCRPHPFLLLDCLSGRGPLSPAAPPPSTRGRHYVCTACIAPPPLSPWFVLTPVACSTSQHVFCE